MLTCAKTMRFGNWRNSLWLVLATTCGVGCVVDLNPQPEPPGNGSNTDNSPGATASGGTSSGYNVGAGGKAGISNVGGVSAVPAAGATGVASGSGGGAASASGGSNAKGGSASVNAGGAGALNDAGTVVVCPDASDVARAVDSGCS